MTEPPAEVPAGEFKARCLKLMDAVRATRRAIVITKRGKPIAKLIPLGTDSASLIGSLRGKLKIKGDIMSTGIKWHAES